MKAELTDRIKGYHYTNSRAYRSMQTNGVDGYITFGFEDFAGLIPGHRFVRYGEGNGLPEEAYKGVIEGLLEPEPRSWTDNPEFPNFWRILMHDICRDKDVVLLRFELKPEDKAYVVERAHIERELYRESKGLGKPTRETTNEAFRKYWQSRVPVFDYDGSYSTPQLAIWSGISFERLQVEWVKPSDDVWKRVLENNW
jgi:hypothetical protein